MRDWHAFVKQMASPSKSLVSIIWTRCVSKGLLVSAIFIVSQIAKLTWPTWGSPGADRTGQGHHIGPMDFAIMVVIFLPVIIGKDVHFQCVVMSANDFTTHWQLYWQKLTQPSSISEHRWKVTFIWKSCIFLLMYSWPQRLALMWRTCWPYCN